MDVVTLALINANQKVLSIKQFGARGDGQTDDTAAIQACIDAAVEQKARVLIPPSDQPYMISDRIVLHTGVFIEGAGVDSCLRLVDNANVTSTPVPVDSTNYASIKALLTTLRNDGVKGVVLKNFCIDGNGDNQSNPNDSYAGIFLNNSSECLVQDMIVRNIGRMDGNTNRSAGLLIISGGHHIVRGGWYQRVGYECIGVRGRQVGAKHVTIQGVHLKDGDVHALALQRGVQYITVEGVTIDQSGADREAHGITCHGPTDCTISNVVGVVRGGGLRIFDGAERIMASNVRLVTDNSVRLDPPLYIWSSVAGQHDPVHDIAVTNSQFTSTGGNACRVAEIDNASGVKISGCTFFGKHPQQYEPVRVLGGSENVSILDCVIETERPSAATVYVFDGSANVLIHGCDLRGGRGGVRTSSTSGATNVSVIGNNLSDVSNPLVEFEGVGSGRVARDNIGAVTRNVGTVTLSAGDTSTVFDHGLTAWRAIRKTDFQVTPLSPLGNATQFWIDDVTNTSITIRVDVAPGVDVEFAITADCSEL